MRIPTIAIIGRPNVGKSTLFNALAGTQKALTDKVAGTTRDRIIQKIETPAMDVWMVDTGGIAVGAANETIENNIRKQADIAIDEADVIVFLTENSDAGIECDLEIARSLRKKIKTRPVVLGLNKCDRPLSESDRASWYRLGWGSPVLLSAIHGNGLDQLMEAIVVKCRELHFVEKTDPRYQEMLEESKKMPRIAIVGKPNVGKSSLINAWLNKERVIVSPIPGTTRDSIDTEIQVRKNPYLLIDTAGIRRAGKMEKGIEKWSNLRTLLSIEQCDIAVLVLDSSERISHQDQQIAGMIMEAKKGMVILMNKWDLCQKNKKKETSDTESTRSAEKEKNAFMHYLKSKFAFLPWVPVIFTSALTRQEMTKIFGLFDKIDTERRKRIETSRLNQLVTEITLKHLPSGTKNARPKIYYITQVDVDPPHFVVFVNKRENFHFSYLRYLENRLREKFGFVGTSIDIEFREKGLRN